MAKVKTPSSSSPKKAIRPALSPENREQQLINLAMDLVEQRMLDGTASSQETTHFLKLGTSKARYETKLLEAQTELAVAKAENIKYAQRKDEEFAAAIKAMMKYQGKSESEDDENQDVY